MFIMCSTKISQMFQNELISKIGEILSNYKVFFKPINLFIIDFGVFDCYTNINFSA